MQHEPDLREVVGAELAARHQAAVQGRADLQQEQGKYRAEGPCQSAPSRAEEQLEQPELHGRQQPDVEDGVARRQREPEANLSPSQRYQHIDRGSHGHDRGRDSQRPSGSAGSHRRGQDRDCQDPDDGSNSGVGGAAQAETSALRYHPAASRQR